MERWRKILRRWAPRDDMDREFYADHEEIEQPVLVNTMGPMAAAMVAARLLRAVVVRRGSLIRPSAVEKLEQLLGRGLPDEVVHHCEAEAERILEWIERRPTVGEPAPEGAGGEPDFDVMVKADLESRLSVAIFALDEGYDLELEYFDEETSSWPRTRAQLLDIADPEAADFQTTLQLRDQRGDFEISVKYVRWLMPIPPRPESDDGEQGGEVLQFPGDVDES